MIFLAPSVKSWRRDRIEAAAARCLVSSVFKDVDGWDRRRSIGLGSRCSAQSLPSARFRVHRALWNKKPIAAKNWPSLPAQMPACATRCTSCAQATPSASAPVGPRRSSPFVGMPTDLVLLSRSLSRDDVAAVIGSSAVNSLDRGGFHHHRHITRVRTRRTHKNRSAC